MASRVVTRAFCSLPLRAAQIRAPLLRAAFSTAEASFIDKDEVSSRVLNVVKNFEKVDVAKVSESAKFVEDLGLDSLDTVRLCVVGQLFVQLQSH